MLPRVPQQRRRAPSAAISSSRFSRLVFRTVVVSAILFCFSALLTANTAVIPALGARAQTVSLARDVQLLQQSDCVRKCLVGRSPDIVAALGCRSGRANACFCQADRRPAATSFVSHCFATDYTTCVTAADYASAISVYDRYCGFRSNDGGGGEGDVVVVTTVTAADGGPRTTTIAARAGGGQLATPTATSGLKSGGSGNAASGLGSAVVRQAYGAGIVAVVAVMLGSLLAGALAIQL